MKRSLDTVENSDGLDVIEIPIETASQRKEGLQDNQTEVDSKAATKLWTKDFLVITLINFMLFCGFQFFPSSLPLFIKELGAPDSVIGWVTGLTTISALIIRPFGGMILDRFGRKGIFLLSLLIMIGVSFSYAFFPIVGVILLIRFIHGVGWGLATTATSTIATDVIPRKRFGEGMGYFSLSASLAMAIAPGVAIMLFHSAGMTSISFLATGVLICALLLAIIMKYQPVAKPENDSSKKRFQLFEKSAAFPSAVVFFVTASYGAIVTFVAVYASEQGIFDIGWFFTIYAVALLITRPFLGRIVDKRGARAVVLPGVIALSAGLVILSFSTSLLLFLASAVVYAFGFGACQSGLQTLAIASSPPDKRGIANATFFTGFDGGLGFGCIISGIVVTAVGYATMYLLFALLPIIAGILFVAKRERA